MYEAERADYLAAVRFQSREMVVVDLVVLAIAILLFGLLASPQMARRRGRGWARAGSSIRCQE